MKFLHLNDIHAYKISFKLSNYVWSIVTKWDYFPKSSVGSQFTQAIDSISANIAEGFGRFHKKDKIKFYYNSRASVFESLDWLQKSKIRKLISQLDYDNIFKILTSLPKEINSLIRYTEIHLTI